MNYEQFFFNMPNTPISFEVCVTVVDSAFLNPSLLRLKMGSGAGLDVSGKNIKKKNLLPLQGVEPSTFQCHNCFWLSLSVVVDTHLYFC